MTTVFVYGTLKRGCKNHALLAGQTFVSPARSAPGHRLHDLGDYPGLVFDDADAAGVIGELWSVNDAALAELDAFEGVNEGLYARRPLRLAPPHADLRAETYVYLPSVAGRPAVGPEWRE